MEDTIFSPEGLLLPVNFYGKGGSGKTTSAALYSWAVRKLSELEGTNITVVAVDLDVNQGLGAFYRTLIPNLAGDPPSLGMDRDAVNAYLNSGKVITDNVRFAFDRDSKFHQYKDLRGPDGQMYLDQYGLKIQPNHYVVRSGSPEKDKRSYACQHFNIGGLELIGNTVIPSNDVQEVYDLLAGATTGVSTIARGITVGILRADILEASLAVIEQLYEEKDRLAEDGIEMEVKVIILGTTDQRDWGLTKLCLTEALSKFENKELDNDIIPYTSTPHIEKYSKTQSDYAKEQRILRSFLNKDPETCISSLKESKGNFNLLYESISLDECIRLIEAGNTKEILDGFQISKFVNIDKLIDEYIPLAKYIQDYSRSITQDPRAVLEKNYAILSHFAAGSGDPVHILEKEYLEIMSLVQGRKYADIDASSLIDPTLRTKELSIQL